MLDALGQPQTMVVLGGSSDIARAVVVRSAGRRLRTVVLAGRDAGRLAAAADEARRAGATDTPTVVFEATDVTGAPAAVDACFDSCTADVDVVLVAVGMLSRQERELDPAFNADVTLVTHAWPVAAITRAAALLVRQGHGRIVVLSSVAAVRARRANFVYGAAKAGLDAFCLGLAEALAGTGVDVTVVRPGFVHTKMTEGLPPAPFAVTAFAVAEAIEQGLASNEQVVWAPPVLRLASVVMRLLPGALWRRLSA